ncbi:translocation/assembly module TamB domain-containing protein [Elioraea rosea]|uniref:translocation/assembly module TamB domain-containing protein n=1 Tax=Elioraea rosea TaxID=2492390 RepID=UPI0011836AF0|nr:translocation/assembly module TamB domain-containing protein [Elioraea rosea]
MRPDIRRAARILLRVVLAIPVALLALALLLVAALETTPGQSLLRAAIVRTAGIELAGLEGSPLRRTTLSGLVLRDEDGPWLSIDRVALAWSPTALFQRTVSIDMVEIAGLALLRMPRTTAESDDVTPAPATAGSDALPVSVRVGELRVVGARVAAALLDAEADALLDGEARLAVDRDLRGRASASIALSGIGEGRVALEASRADTITARLTVAEPQDGFVARLAGLPALGALEVQASLDGAVDGATLDARLGFGAGLSVTASGVLDTVGSGNDISVWARAEATALAAALGQAATVEAVDAAFRLTGALSSPSVEGTLTAPSIGAGGARLSSLHAALSMRPEGAARRIEVDATAAEIVPPDPVAPLGETRLTASVRLEGDGAVTVQALQLASQKASLTAEGMLAPGGKPSGTGHVSIDALGALLPTFGIDGSLDARVATAADGALAIDATLRDAAGPEPLAALLGPLATLSATGHIAPHPRIDRFSVQGQAIEARGSGALAEEIALDATIELPVLNALAEHLHGYATVRLSASGAMANPTIALALSAPRIGVAGLPEGTLTVDATVADALTAPDVTASASGSLAGDALALSLRVLPQTDRRLDIPEARFSWGDMRANASGAILPDGRPNGTVSLAAPRLEPLGRLLAQPLAGSLTLEATARPERSGVAVIVSADAAGVSAPGVRVEALSLRARAEGELATPDIEATLDARRVVAGGITTAARVEAKGRPDDLALTVALDGAAHRLRAEARFAAATATLRLASLAGQWKGETARLVAPATITLAPVPGVDRLALALGSGGRVEASGIAGERLDLSLSARRLPLSLASLVAPELSVTGTLDATARITGTQSAPEGTARVTVRGAGLPGTPRADVDAELALAGAEARATGRIRSGRNADLRFDVAAPIADPQAGRGSLAGTIALALLDPILAPAGREARGRLLVDLRLQNRQLGGSVQIADASFNDSQLGFRLDGIAGRIDAERDRLRLDVGARAGEGRLALAGTVSPLDPAIPVNLRLTANDATVVVGSRLSTRFDADVGVEGAVAQGLVVRGRIDVERADARLPERLPANIVALPVEVVGQAAAAPAPAPADMPVPITLDVTIDAPRAVFVRGQGLDAELGGSLRATGPATAPRLDGTLSLRNGTLSRLGQEFRFRRGTIVFDGAAGYDPTLDFEAARQLSDMTALIRVGGRPSALTVTLASDPEAPSDEVLSRILFGRAQNSLTPSQLVQLASAAAELAGLTEPGGGILDRARQQLGLDRLSAGTSDDGGGQVEAGRYVADGVYVGARQRTDGSSQATIQLEVLPGVRLEADIGGESSDRVGASIGFEY